MSEPVVELDGAPMMAVVPEAATERPKLRAVAQSSGTNGQGSAFTLLGIESHRMIVTAAIAGFQFII